VAVDADGRTLTGIMTNETSSSVTLQEQEGKTHVLLRRDLEALRATGKSLMPEGLEKDVSPEQVDELIAWLMQFGPPPKMMEGNAPRVVVPAEDGTITLSAQTAEIYGDQIAFEQALQNIGFWHSPTDRVSWRVEVPSPHDYDLFLEWSCAEESAGNTFRIEGVVPAVTGTVVATGGWDRYERVKVGTARLDAGHQYVTVRPDGPLRRALLDLRAVVLVPSP
jgi:hypothetical protein